MPADDQLGQYARALRAARDRRPEPAEPTVSAPDVAAPPTVFTAPLPPRHLESAAHQRAIERRLAYAIQQRYQKVLVGAAAAYLVILVVVSVTAKQLHPAWPVGWLASMVVLAAALAILHRPVILGQARADAEAAEMRDQDRHNARRHALPPMLLQAQKQHDEAELMACFDTMMEAHRLIRRHQQYLDEHYPDGPPADDLALIAQAEGVYRALTKHGEKPLDRIRE